MTDNLLRSLNDVQRKAVQHVEGPALCLLSAAGSGKTRVITHRIAYLIAHYDVSPFRILAVTFTNKAANEMKERLDALIGENISKDIWVSTFHATCARILRQEIDKLEDYTRSFTIFDTTDQVVVVKEALKKLGRENRQYNPRAILSHISRAKNDFLKPAAYADIAGDYFEEIVAQVYPIYQDLLCRNNALDFDDLLLLTLELFDDHPDVLERYQHKFKHILVDEFQDTNQCQYRIVKQLAKPHGNLCVVGDDDQSIYAFRGADIRNILNFEEDYKDAEVFPLEQNYRSTKNILDAAWSVVRNNKARKKKRLWTENDKGDPVFCYEAVNENDEANYVATQIENLHVEGVDYADFAIFYRTTAQSRVFEEAFRAANIPYQIVGGVGFYDRMEIKDLLAYLRVICNPDDSISLRRIINIPGRGIGMKTIQRLIDFAASERISLFEAVKRVNEISQISGGIKTKVKKFNNIFDSLSDDILPSDALYHILQTTKYLENLEGQNTLEAQGRIENIEQLINAITEYETYSSAPSLADYLENVALTMDVDAMETDETNVVPLMTLHSAKGLEFPFVFIVGVEEGYLPHQRSIDAATAAELEEERRLCYVGITRAMERLYLVHADARRIFGNSEYRTPSRFISEIPDQLIKHVDRYHSPFHESTGLYEEVPEDADDYSVDQIVHHPQFGRGKITKVTGAGQNVYITVRFSRAGMTRRFAASLAPLTMSD